MKITTRQRMLLDQNGECAFCGHKFDLRNETPCGHKESGVLVCRQCVMLVTQIMAVLKRLIRPKAFVDCFAHFIKLAGIEDPEAMPTILEELGCVLDEQGRFVDKDGNFYDKKGVVLGNIHEGEE
jgi:hypothetical protein